jgi:hypothetical protein
MTIAVRTPTYIEVVATCPTCEQPQAIGLSLTAELLVSDEGSELRLKSKSKGVAHTCDQLPLDLDQAALDTVLDRVAEQVNAGALDDPERGVTATMTRVGGRKVDPETGEILECVRQDDVCVTHDATWPEVAKACWAVVPPRKRAAS